MIQYLRRLAPVASLLAVLACGGEEGTVPGKNGRFPDFSDVRRTYTCEDLCEGMVRGCARTGQFTGEKKLRNEYMWCIEDCDVDKLNANLDKPLGPELEFPKEYKTVGDIVRCTVDGNCPDKVAGSKAVCG